MPERVIIPVKHVCPDNTQGDIIADAAAFQCLGCGKEWVDRNQLNAFFEMYRNEIKRDLLNHDNTWLEEHWGFSVKRSGQLRRHIDQDEPGPVSRKPAPSRSPGPGPYGLPPWNDNWNYQLQLRWLEIWYTFKTEEVKTDNEQGD